MYLKIKDFWYTKKCKSIFGVPEKQSFSKDIQNRGVLNVWRCFESGIWSVVEFAYALGSCNNGFDDNFSYNCDL